MKICALIMAGGRGERFWPKSRKSLPKQFLSLTGDGKTMIQLTVERILPLVDMEDIFIATNEDYRGLVQKQLPALPPENILCEPIGRNTAPCIGLGAVHMSAKYKDALMLVLPSDHLIHYNDIFTATLRDACHVAEDGENLVTIGITPNYPETGYGYIKYQTGSKQGNAFLVDSFVEKPDLETAKKYLEDGSYLWNSGMFVWKVSTILSRMEALMPETHEGLMRIGMAVGTPEEDRILKKEFPALPSISVDYGIMEKSDSIFTFPGSFGWDDVGSWLALERIQQNDARHNTLQGNVLQIDCEHTIIQAGDKLIAAVGVKDLIIVDTDDATLVCGRESTADIKKLLEQLRSSGSDKYL